MQKSFFLFFFFSLFSFSQERTITGIVSDSLNKPLERANVIAKPLQDNAGLKFAIADHLGRFKLVLESNINFRNEFLSSPRLDNQVHCYTGKVCNYSENFTFIFTLKNSGIACNFFEPNTFL